MCGRKMSMARSTSASLVEMWKDRRRRPARADPAIRAAAMAAGVPSSTARETIAEFPGSRSTPGPRGRLHPGYQSRADRAESAPGAPHLEARLLRRLQQPIPGVRVLQNDPSVRAHRPACRSQPACISAATCDHHDGRRDQPGPPPPSPISVRRLSEALRSVADDTSAGVAPADGGELPPDIELQQVTNAVRSVLAVLTPGEARRTALRYPAKAIHSSCKTGCSAAWLARVLWVHEVAGSSPASPTGYCCCFSGNGVPGSSSATWNRYAVARLRYGRHGSAICSTSCWLGRWPS